MTTGESLWAPVRFTKYNNNNNVAVPDRGTYVDISAGVSSSGLYRAQIITKGQNTYAAGYVVDDYTNVVTGNNYFVAANTNDRVYYNADTITFLVATGRGSAMTVKSVTGVENFKAAYNIPANGMIKLSDAAMTVSKTSTGNWNASVVFVLAEDIDTEASYVFLPSDININSQWSSVEGYNDVMLVTYSNAYMNGEKTSIKLKLSEIKSQFADGVIDRGFYTLTAKYDSFGNAYYSLVEKVDNAPNGFCFYKNANVVDTGSSWELDDYDIADGVKIVDVTDPTHEVSTIAYVWQWIKNHNDGHGYVAYTVNPVTKEIDVIYLVDAGWDASLTISLSSALKAAGWKIVDDAALVDELSYEDDAAYANDNQSKTVTLYNEKLDGRTTTSTTYSVTVTKDNATTGTAVNGLMLDDGKIAVTFTVAEIPTTGNKDLSYEIDGLVIGTVTINAGNGRKVASTTPNKDVVLGTEVTVKLATDDDEAFVVDTDGCDKVAHYHWEATLKHGDNTVDYKVTDGQLTTNSHIIEFTFVPFHNNMTYEVTGAAWVHNANVAD